MRTVEEFTVTPADPDGRTEVPVKTGEDIHNPIVCDHRLDTPVMVLEVNRRAVFVEHDPLLVDERRDTGIEFQHSGGGERVLQGELEVVSNASAEGVGLCRYGSCEEADYKKSGE